MGSTDLVGVVSDEEIAQAVHRIRGRSAQPLRDIALFYTLFATGSRPLEVARLGKAAQDGGGEALVVMIGMEPNVEGRRIGAKFRQIRVANHR